MSEEHLPWRIYDPRRGEDRRFRIRQDEVSTAHEGLWFAEGGYVDWNQHLPFLEAAIVAAGGQVYVTFLSWAPGRKRNMASFREHFTPAIEIDEGLLIASPADASVSRALLCRTEMGGSHSGLWSFGTTNSFDSLVQSWREAGKEGDSPTMGTVAARKSISFAVCMDDSLDCVFARLGGGAASIPDLFLRMVTAGQES
jgi:hypothetical protein